MIADALVSHLTQLSLDAWLELLVSAQSLRPEKVSARTGEILVVSYSLSNIELGMTKVLSASRKFEEFFRLPSTLPWRE